MFGFRTPAKNHTQNSEDGPPGTTEEIVTLESSLSPNPATQQRLPSPLTAPTRSQKPKMKPLSQEDRKNKVTEATVSPVSKRIYTSRIAEAKACLTKAKLHLGNSRNLKTDIKAEVTSAIERLYQLVKEAEAEGRKDGKNKMEEREDNEGTVKDLSKGKGEREEEFYNKMKEYALLIKQNEEKMEELKQALGEQRVLLEKSTNASLAASAENTEQLRGLKAALDKNSAIHENPNPTYANIAAQAHTPKPVQPALHSIIISSEDDLETGEEVLERVRKAVDAKEGWIKVERVRKAKGSKIILGCSTAEDRDKARQRLESCRLQVEDAKNRDPMIILRDLLNINSDEEVLRALRKQNGEVFGGLGEGDDRIQVKYRKKARNPHTSHLVLSVSPKIWRRATELGALRVDLQRVKVMDQSPLVQCSRCLAYGHTRKYYTEDADICSHCGGPHVKANCEQWEANVAPTCKNCIRGKIGRPDHNAFSEECPVRRRWETLARSTVAYC